MTALCTIRNISIQTVSRYENNLTCELMTKSGIHSNWHLLQTRFKTTNSLSSAHELQAARTLWDTVIRTYLKL